MISTPEFGEAALRRRIADLEAQLGRMNPFYGHQGTVGFTPQEWGINYSRNEGSLYKGGIVATPITNIPDTQGTGTVTLTWNTARLTNTVLCRLRLDLAATGGGGTLISELSKATASLQVNDAPVPEIQNLPLILLTTTLTGDVRYAAVNRVLPSDARLTLVITFNAALSGGPGGTDVTASMEAGDTCDTYPGVHYPVASF